VSLDYPAEDIVWQPTPKQSDFLACDDYEVLYGGAAGGGKSDSLLIDAWCLPWNGPQHPQHRGILFRRSFPELKDLIDRSHELYPQFIEGAHYDKIEHRWKTPWGAMVEFGYLNADNDRFKYRGRAWNYIGFDELTLWPTATCYLYLMSRNRTTARDLPRYMRGTTNPDGVGQRWVMERWGIEEDGGPTCLPVSMMFEEEDGEGGYREVPRTFTRRFIPAKLTDNKHLRGTGYRETLMMLPPEERDALLAGRWSGNRVEGAFYFRELQAARAQQRIGKVPFVPGVPVNTFWDLGYNDFNSIWFHQQIGLTNRFIHAYQNSGYDISHYTRYLQELGTERGYVYGKHYVPHDAANTSLQTGKTMIQLLREQMAGQSFEIVPRVDHVLVGINQTRAAFAGCWFDEEECADGLASLAAYRKRFNKAIGAFTDEPIHDSHSNYADAFRQYAQGYNPAAIITKDSGDWKRRLLAAKTKGRSYMSR
jgi:hypothetical protein